MANDKWVVDRYPISGKDVLLDSLFEGLVVGYYDSVTDDFYSRETQSIVPEVRGWQDLPEQMVEFVSLKQRVLMKGSNLSVTGKKK